MLTILLNFLHIFKMFFIIGKNLFLSNKIVHELYYYFIQNLRSAYAWVFSPVIKIIL
jgi:hypothetical protein